MKSSILLFVTLTVCFHLVFSLDCTNAPGISFIPCQNPSASSTGGSGGSGGTGAGSSQDNAIVVEPCTDIQYNGGAPQKYTVTNQAVPQEFELLFETLNIPDGEKLLIKTFKCDPNNDCKIAVIDSTAATPLSVNINKYSFTLASRSSSVSANFKLNYNCGPSPVDGNWSNWGPWTDCNNDCEQQRVRQCNNPPPLHGGQDCIGDGIQIQSCTGGFCAPAASGCDDFTQEGSLLLKKQPTWLNFQECFDACETDESRMLKITSTAESNALPPDYRFTWLGVKQTGPNTYKWNDNTTFTVTLANGNIPEYSINPWYTYSGTTYPSGWDQTGYDSNNCLIKYSGGWSDLDCNNQRPCVCECTLR